MTQVTTALEEKPKGNEAAAEIKEKILYFGEEAILETFLMLAAIVFLVTSFQYPPQSRLFPTLVLVPLIIGLAAEIWGAIHMSKQALEKETKQRRSTLFAAFFIIVLLALIYVGGLPAGIGVFPLLYMRFYCKESWKTTIVVTLFLGIGTYIFLTKLNLPMFWGVLGDILGW
jgi:cadmium resistance protein CadD (predicted permease)